MAIFKIFGGGGGKLSDLGGGGGQKIEHCGGILYYRDYNYGSLSEKILLCFLHVATWGSNLIHSKLLY